MKCLIYTDPHFCEKYSIVSKVGDKYTQRLENVIKSVNWAEDLAYKTGCKYVICAGDFFDKANLTQQELTALNEINFAPTCKHYFLVGNHESEESDLHYNSTEALHQDHKDSFIISEPTVVTEANFELAFLPYIPEVAKKDINSYFSPKKLKRLLISHNDLLGVQLGPVISTVGFKPAELENICDLCVNGHLHNGKKISDKVLNLGNLTGKDFGENAFKYTHNVLIFDTDSWTYELIENPYALNFYQLDIDSDNDLDKLASLKNNAVVSVRCKIAMAQKIRDKIATLSNIIDHRIVIIREINVSTSENTIADLTVDQCVKFAECCREKIAASDILEAELAEILK